MRPEECLFSLHNAHGMNARSVVALLPGTVSMQHGETGWWGHVDSLVAKASLLESLELDRFTSLREDIEQTALHPGKPTIKRRSASPSNLSILLHYALTKLTCSLQASTYSISIMCMFMCLHIRILGLF